MRTSFSPASTKAPSSRMPWQTALYRLACRVFCSGRDPLERLAAAFHGELDEGVARAGRRRRPQDLDPGGGQGRVDVAPRLVRIGDELALALRDVLGQRQEQVPATDLQRRRGLGVGEDDAVVPDLDLDDLGDAVFGAGLDLGLLDAAGSVRHVGVLDADAGAEQFEAAARPGALDHRGLEPRGLAEGLGHGRGERIYRRRTDDADPVARLGGPSDRDAGQYRQGQQLAAHYQVSPSLQLDGRAKPRRRSPMPVPMPRFLRRPRDSRMTVSLRFYDEKARPSLKVQFIR